MSGRTVASAITCYICSAIGEHDAASCPKRTIFTVGEGRMLPDAYVAPHELMTAVARHPGVPQSLQCCACAQLARDAMWVACCNVLSCLECLGPASGPWICAECGRRAADGDVWAVRAVREVIDAFEQVIAVGMDPAFSSPAVLPVAAARHAASCTPKRQNEKSTATAFSANDAHTIRIAGKVKKRRRRRTGPLHPQ